MGQEVAPNEFRFWPPTRKDSKIVAFIKWGEGNKCRSRALPRPHRLLW